MKIRNFDSCPVKYYPVKYLISIGFFLLVGGIAVFSTNNIPEPPYHAKRIFSTPVIDGKPSDVCWDSATWAPIDQVWIGSPTTADDYTGLYKVVWTPDRLYILLKIIRKMINDNYPDPCAGNYNYECAEIFIDEDQSGGNHLNNYNAFSYHMTTKNNVCDHGPDGQGTYLFNDDVKLRFDSSAGNHTYYWEVELKVFNDQYEFGGNNVPVTLFAGKKMGFSLAYNTNDGGTQRKNMFGSHYLPGPDKNTSYITASDFGELILDGETSTKIQVEKNREYFNCFPDPGHSIINIVLENQSFENVKIQLFNILGKEVISSKSEKSRKAFHKELDVTNLPKGIYIIKVGNGQKQYVQKVSWL
jgi:hypothetical protein